MKLKQAGDVKSPACRFFMAVFQSFLPSVQPDLSIRNAPAFLPRRAGCETPSSLRGFMSLFLNLYRFEHMARKFFIFLIDLNDRSLVDVSSEDVPRGCFLRG